MAVKHISEVLDEFFRNRTRNILDFIKKNSYDTFFYARGQDELKTMIELGYTDRAEVYISSHQNMVYGLWRN